MSKKRGVASGDSEVSRGDDSCSLPIREEGFYRQAWSSRAIRTTISTRRSVTKKPSTTRPAKSAEKYCFSDYWQSLIGLHSISTAQPIMGAANS